MSHIFKHILNEMCLVVNSHVYIHGLTFDCCNQTEGPFSI